MYLIMLELCNDQIHAPAFQNLCDFIWSPDPACPYVNGVMKQTGMKLFNQQIKLQERTGIIYIGLCQLIEDCFAHMPKTGSYIIVHRTNDRSFIQAMYDRKPTSVKHIYTVDCAVNEPDVTAIPFGLNSINGEDEVIKHVPDVTQAETKLFCRFNINRDTLERNEWLPKLQAMPFAKVVTEQISSMDFFKEIKAHEFTMSLQGLGKDCARTYAAMLLGSIPIVTDCVEMRHFSDMPLLYCPEELTEEWLDSQVVSGSTERMRMSYWVKEIQNKRKELWS